MGEINPISSKNPFKPFIYAVVLAAGIFLGYIISLNAGAKTHFGANTTGDKWETILKFVQQKYVDTLNVAELEEKAINEMLASLDPHSFYIPPVDLTDINDDMKGNFEGIGVEFFIVDDTITIVNAIAGGPSEKIGIQAGDKIIAVNDSTVAGVGVQNSHVVKLLKGPKGTKVAVTVYRNKKKQKFTIIRDKIPLHSVDIAYMLDKKTGIIKINKFSDTTYDEFYNSLLSLKRSGLQNLIIDLRQNGGGYLRTAVFIADELLAGKKLVVYTEGAHYKREEYEANRPGEFEEGKIIILVDENSASASEILAGAVQDWDRGLIIGRRTYGKGLVQEQYDMADHSALRLTVARYYIPSGRSIQKPYTNTDAYNNEVYDRYLSGEVYTDAHTQEDTTAYYTKIKKRKVYAGGGIHPDVFIPLDSVNNNAYVNQLKSYVPGFVYAYYSDHKQSFKQYNSVESFDQNFVVNADLMNLFLSYAESKEWKKDMSKMPANEKNLKQFMKAFFAKQLFQNEGYFKILFQQDPYIKEALQQFK